MTLAQWIALPASVVMAAFIVFAFRAGFKVPPSGKDPKDRNDYT